MKQQRQQQQQPHKSLFFAVRRNADGMVMQYPADEASKLFCVSTMEATCKGVPFSEEAFLRLVNGWKRQGADMENDTVKSIVTPIMCGISWAMLEPRPNNPQVYFIAAACSVCYNDALPSKLAHLSGFFVEPALQRKGNGKQYIERLKMIWSIFGIKRVTLVSEHAKAGFWQKCGFQTVGAPTRTTSPEELMIAFATMFQPMFRMYAVDLEVPERNSFLTVPLK